MARVDRRAEIVWEGNVARGTGSLSAASSGAFRDLPYSLPSRIGNPEGKTSPEELLAAAHGGCVAMSLASELTQRQTPPGRIEVSCTVTIDEVEGQGHRIVASDLALRVAVAGLPAEELAEIVDIAERGCPFSALLRAGGAAVSVRSEALGD